MRVALIQAPQREAENAIPLGLLCLATYIKQHNHKPIIIDLNLLAKNHKIQLDFFRKAARRILNHRPQILGFSAMCSTLPATLLISKECKKLASNIPIILGGPEVSFEEIALLKNFKQIDIIIRGEGEITLLEVVNAIEGKKEFASVLGITYRERNRILRNADRPLIKDLDSLPYLDFSLLPHIKRYSGGKIEAGRGCPYNCTFCSTCKMWQRKFRIKSPQRLFGEIKQANSIFKQSIISVVHDNLLASRKAADNFLSLLTNKAIAWSCSSRLEHLDKELIKKLKKAGCKGIYLGIESGSPMMQKAIKKNMPLARLPQILDMLQQNNIEVYLSFIIGFPDEKISQINQTLTMALKTRIHCCFPTTQIHPLTLLKGSELFSDIKSKLWQFYYGQTDISPSSIYLPAELSLIKKHPDIFPSFYYLQRKDLPARFIEKISILYFFLLDFFPLTTFLLTKYLSLNPLKLCQKMIAFLESQGADWIIFQDGKDNFSYYLPFVKKFMSKNSNLLAKETFQHEELFAKSNFLKKPHRSNLKIKMNSRIKIGKNIKAREYHYDIIDFIENKKYKRKKKIPKFKSYIAYIPGEAAKVIPLTASLYCLLLLCNGRRSVHKIIEDLQELDSKQNKKKISKIILQKFRFLKEQSIISAA